MRPQKRRGASRGTLTRLGKLSEVWSTLPNMPGNNQPFVAGKIDQEALDELHDDLDAKLKTFSRCDQEFQTVAGALNELDAEHADFISGALVQGRKQFEPGTAGRRVIDAVPTPSAPASPAAPHESATQPNNAASTGAASPTVVAPAAPPSSNTTTVSFDTPAAANQ